MTMKTIPVHLTVLLALLVALAGNAFAQAPAAAPQATEEKALSEDQEKDLTIQVLQEQLAQLRAAMADLQARYDSMVLTASRQEFQKKVETDGYVFDWQTGKLVKAAPGGTSSPATK